tara:strand:+ start:1200 stop:1646 length:447 start_codon:yes stop_codon:yes gene_type:complete
MNKSVKKWTNKRLIAEVPKLVKELTALPRIYHRGSQKGKILFKLLLAHQGGWDKVRTLEFNSICFRYPSRISEMREDGWNIITESKGFQEHYYRLGGLQSSLLAQVMTDSDFQDAYLQTENAKRLYENFVRDDQSWKKDREEAIYADY